jgi:Polyphosphate kinase 2 (PPK2)
VRFFMPQGWRRCRAPPAEENRCQVAGERLAGVSASDVRERQDRDDYQHTYSQMLTHTSTEWAPWHVLPADHKWFTRLCAARVIVQALVEIDPAVPGS